MYAMAQSVCRVYLFATEPQRKQNRKALNKLFSVFSVPQWQSFLINLRGNEVIAKQHTL